MGTQKKIAKTIVNKDEDYILSVKENHKTLYNDTGKVFSSLDYPLNGCPLFPT
jgi:predicted transposase YbfD/YdcC